MKTRSVVVCLAVLSLFGLSLIAQPQQFVLPQVGSGTYAGGSIRTTFILFNPTNGAIDATIRLRNDAGSPMLVTIPSVGTTDEFGPFTLQKGETRILQTDGSGALSVGSAVIDTSGPLGVSAVFSLYDGQKSFLTEAGVGSAEIMTDFVIPVDAAGGFNTGLALVNLGQADANITYRLVDADGQVADTTTATLGARQHLARFVSGPGELFPNVSNFQGTLQVTSTQNLAALTIRQNGAPLSYTTLPVVSKAATPTSFNLPQVANGVDPASNLTLKTTFVVFNLGAGVGRRELHGKKTGWDRFSADSIGEGKYSRDLHSNASGRRLGLPSNGRFGPSFGRFGASLVDGALSASPRSSRSTVATPSRLRRVWATLRLGLISHYRLTRRRRSAPVLRFSTRAMRRSRSMFVCLTPPETDWLSLFRWNWRRKRRPPSLCPSCFPDRPECAVRWQCAHRGRSQP